MTRTNGHSVRSEAEDLLDSTLDLGFAATKFAMDQMETAMYVFTSPGRAMERLRRSMDNVSKAMKTSVQEMEDEHGETRHHGGSAGRKT